MTSNMSFERKLNRYDTMIQALQALKRRGFKAEFTFENKEFRNLSNDKMYQPDDMRILEYHRFEGKSNPADSSVVFAIACQDGTKGTLVSSYGMYSDPGLMNVLQKIRIAQESDKNTPGE